MELDYVRLAPGFAREVLEICENWEGKDTVPMKVRELMMVIEIEVNNLYDPGGRDRIATMPKPPKLKDTKLGRDSLLLVQDCLLPKQNDSRY